MRTASARTIAEVSTLATVGRLVACLLLTFVVVGERPARAADDESVVLWLRAERHASAGRCDDALPLLRRVRKLDPEHARAALVEGQCAIQLRRYGKAIEPLRTAKRLDSTLSEADLSMAIASYHLGEYARAERALAAFEKRDPNRAELHLYKGLILLQRAEAQGAAAELERARSIDPGAVEPVASYFAGLAFESIQERDRAEQALRRVSRESAGTIWSEQADRVLSRMAKQDRLRYWVGASSGFEYDDNVVLRGTGVNLPSNISDDGDVRGLWSVNGGVELYRSDDWVAGLLASYSGSAHDDLNAFDEHFTRTALWVDRRLDDLTFLSLLVDFGYSWL
ncbi:MAG: tetratricopeptide repeat protein, partial [Myxococcota bacterium]